MGLCCCKEEDDLEHQVGRKSEYTRIFSRMESGGYTESLSKPSYLSTQQGDSVAQLGLDGQNKSPLNGFRVMQPLKLSEGSIERKYKIGELLGNGCTAAVHVAINRSNGRKLACKIVDRYTIEQKYPNLWEKFPMEVQVMQMLQHPNIIKLEDVWITDDKVFMVMEAMSGGELFDYIVEKGTLSELEASSFVRQITSAVAYMHDLNVIHRDLKPENLLLTKPTREGEKPVLKLIDFGLAKQLHSHGPGDMAKSFLGTRGYLAPELLQRDAYNKAVDVWALGVIVFVLLCGCLPFGDDGDKINDEMAKTKFVLRFPPWAQGLSREAKDLLSRLLDVDTNSRITAADALNHPWVSGAHSEALKRKMLSSPGKLSGRTRTPRAAAMSPEHYAEDRARRLEEERIAVELPQGMPPMTGRKSFNY